VHVVLDQVGAYAALRPVLESLSPECSDVTVFVSAAVKQNTGIGIPYADAADIMRFLRPDFAVTSTSLDVPFFRELWGQFRVAGVPVAGFVDQWTNLDARFTLHTPFDTLPDLLLLPDEHTADWLRAKGVLPGRLVVTGHPELARLASGTRHRALDSRSPVVFVSEPVEDIILLRYPHLKDAFGEFDALRALLQEMSRYGLEQLQIRLHPRENRSKYEAFLARELNSGVTVTWNDAPRDALFSQPSCFVGITSVLLLEAAVAGFPAISFCPPDELSDNSFLRYFTWFCREKTSGGLGCSLRRAFEGQAPLITAPAIPEGSMSNWTSLLTDPFQFFESRGILGARFQHDYSRDDSDLKQKGKACDETRY
jgi:hypothetical protein